MNQSELEANLATGTKRGKTPVNGDWLIRLFLLLIAWNKRKSLILQNTLHEFCFNRQSETAQWMFYNRSCNAERSVFTTVHVTHSICSFEKEKIA